MQDGHKVAVEIHERSLSCRLGRECAWTLQIDSLVLLAEYTTSEGPFSDDYFMLFVTVEHGEVFISEASFYATGMDYVLRTLAHDFGIRTEHQLVGSTDWDSRVLWPSEMAGRNYFDFTAVRPDTLGGKVSKWAFGPTLEYRISSDVKAYLETRTRRMYERDDWLGRR